MHLVCQTPTPFNFYVFCSTSTLIFPTILFILIFVLIFEASEPVGSIADFFVELLVIMYQIFTTSVVVVVAVVFVPIKLVSFFSTLFFAGSPAFLFEFIREVTPHSSIFSLCFQIIHKSPHHF